MVAGDPERKHVDLCKRLGGIPYHQNQISFAVGKRHANDISLWFLHEI